MDKLAKVTVLGSGTSFGVPVIGCHCQVCQSKDPKNKRTRSSILLTNSNGKNVVVDTGPELRLQLVRENIDEIDAVFYTHLHADHLHGFDDLRVFYHRNRKRLKLFVPRGCEKPLKERFAYAFNESAYQGLRPHFDLIEFDEGPIEIAGMEFEVAFLPHGHTQSAGFRIGNFAYATDFEHIPERWVKQWRGQIDHMIASGIRFDNPHPTHSLIPETENLFKNLAVKHGVIHHLSHEVEHIEGGKRLGPGHELAYDGMVIDVS